MRVYNFSAGPSMLPLEVLQQAQADFVDYEGCGMSVTEIADRLGFSSQAHFTKVFKKEIGCSPTSYRRSSLHD